MTTIIRNRSIALISRLSEPTVRIGSQMAALPEDEKEQRPGSSSLQEGDLFHDSLFVSGSKSRPRNPWGPSWIGDSAGASPTGASCIPLSHTETLPKWERLTMLYIPPAAAASNDTRLSVPTSTSRYTPTAMRIPSPVQMRQEPPSPPLDTPGGVVGGVPGGVIGGIPNGALSEVLGSTSTTPILAKTLVPTPRRVLCSARVAEANLVYDVAPKYPPEAGQARIEGTVVLLAVIRKDGTVEDVRVESGLPVLAQAAMRKVGMKQWRSVRIY